MLDRLLTSLVEMLVNGPSLDLKINTLNKPKYGDAALILLHSTVEGGPCLVFA